MLTAVVGYLSRSRYRRVFITAHDLFVVTAAFPVSISLRENFSLSTQHAIPAIYGSALLFLIAFIVFRAAGIQQNMWRYSSTRDLINVAKALSAVIAIFIPAMFLIDRLEGIPRSVPIILWFVALAGLCSTRTFYIWAVNRIDNRSLGMDRRRPCRVLVLADIRPSSSIIQTINAWGTHKVKIVGAVSGDAERGRTLLGVAVLGNAERLAQILASLDVRGSYPDAIILGELNEYTRTGLTKHLDGAAPGISVFCSTEIDQLSQFVEDHPPLEQHVETASSPGRYLKIKRMIDIIAAFVGLVVLAPLLAAIAGLTCLLHGAPIMFTQIRAGRHLKEFRLVKFRTMRDPFDRTGRILDDAERVTWLGSLLRVTRLDELPQFWNVLCGDMSLIGPRPLLRRDMPSEQNVLKERYSIRPGITGWAQVNGGHQVNNDQKMMLDIYYIRHASLTFDMKITLMTIKMMFLGEQVDKIAINKAEMSIADL
ncbi:MAG: sugar transferase [Geminicoccaceae bacterium]